MASTLRVKRIGDRLAVDLPAELGFVEGDELVAVETPGGVHLARVDGDMEKALAVTAEFIRRYPDLMDKLAKG